MRCLPTGNPMLWLSWSSLNEKTRESDEIWRLEERMALDHVFVCRKTSLGTASVGSESPSVRTAREASSRDPTWYFCIINLAVSESVFL